MSRSNEPIPPHKQRHDADEPVGDQPEIPAAAAEITKDSPGNAFRDTPDTLPTGSGESPALDDGSENRTVTMERTVNEPGESHAYARDRRSTHRNWILTAILGAALVSGGAGGAVIYLTEIRGQNGVVSRIDVLEAGLARHATEMAEWSARIGDLRNTLEITGDQIADLRAAVEEQSGQMAELRAVTRDSIAIEASLLELSDTSELVMSDLDRFGGTIENLRERIENMEAQPVPINTLTERDIHDRLLEEILGSVDNRLIEMRKALDEGLAEMEAARAAAALSEQVAKQTERAAAAHETLSRIVSALESGMAFATELSIFEEMSGLAPPERLVSIAGEGVPTRGELAEAFPEAARAALRAATMEAMESGDINPVRAFLRTQLGLRSLKPREGDHPDAVLSRAEAAAIEDDIDTALAEIAVLPQSGRDRFADWIAQAELRRGALNAVETLSVQLGN